MQAYFLCINLVQKVCTQYNSRKLTYVVGKCSEYLLEPAFFDLSTRNILGTFLTLYNCFNLTKFAPFARKISRNSLFVKFLEKIVQTKIIILVTNIWIEHQWKGLVLTDKLNHENNYADVFTRFSDDFWNALFITIFLI